MNRIKIPSQEEGIVILNVEGKHTKRINEIIEREDNYYNRAKLNINIFDYEKGNIYLELAGLSGEFNKKFTWYQSSSDYAFIGNDYERFTFFKTPEDFFKKYDDENPQLELEL